MYLIKYCALNTIQELFPSLADRHKHRLKRLLNWHYKLRSGKDYTCNVQDFTV